MKRLCHIGILIVAVNSLISLQSYAQFTFLGPSPYRSAADSPFNLSGLGTSFFLEDFEDFELNTPGILNAYTGVGGGPSVDGDDGAVDGLGEFGGVGAGGPSGCSLMFCGLTSRFQFDNVTFGKYPSYFGIAVTAANDLGFFLRVYDAAGNSSTWDLSAYLFSPESVFDDRFFGVISRQGIKEIEIQSVETRLPPIPIGLRFDHLQYGIPEPVTLTSCLTILVLSLFKRP